MMFTEEVIFFKENSFTGIDRDRIVYFVVEKKYTEDIMWMSK